jgi:transporter family-2 protein
MEFVFILLALAAGACMPVQAGINSQLRTFVGDPAFAAMISFAVGTLALFGFVLASRAPWPSGAEVAQTQWWHWTGGFLGAFLVTMSIILAPRLGATTMLALLVTGQMTVSLILDHFGVVGYPERLISLPRVIGAAMLVGGVVLVQRY